MSYVLSKILAGEKVHQGAWRILKADRDCPFLHEFAHALPSGECLDSLRDPGQIVQNYEALRASVRAVRIRLSRERPQIDQPSAPRGVGS
jgi:hypothetical protein